MADVCQENEKLVMKGGLRMVAVAVGCCNSALMKSILPALFLHLSGITKVCNKFYRGRGERKRRGEGPGVPA